jgi:tripartite-type tricarboxylate transporter receptor subunit TctC
MVSIIPFVLAVNAALPVTSLAEFIAYAKANPNSINYGNPGNGTVSQLNTEFLRYSTGINMTSVPYKGISQAALAVASGDVQAGAGDFASYSPLGPTGSGKVRFLAMFSNTRAAIAPNIPTVSEAGIPDYKPVVPWIGMFVAANTPKEIVARLNRETQRIVQMPHVREVMLKAGAEPALMSVEQFSQYVANEGDDARKRVKAAGIKIE